MKLFFSGMLVFFCLCFFFSKHASAHCVQAPVSPVAGISLKVQQTPGQSGSMLSNVWHQGRVGGLVNCTSEGTYVKYVVLTDSIGVVSTGYLFEGERYTLWKTGNPDVGVIFGSAFSGEAYKPLRQYDDATKLEVSADPDPNVSVKRDYSYRFRYISLKRLAVGEVVVPAEPRMLYVIVSQYYGSGGVLRGTQYYVGGPSVTISVNNTSCSLKVPSVVKLKKANLSLLPSLGSTEEGAKFQLGVVCAASYAPYKILYTMGDVNAPGNTSSKLTTGAIAGSASGIALQVLDGDTPVVFASPTSSSAPKGLLGTMSTQGGGLNKAFSVRYIRTSEKITPGTVNAGVTVTLSYE